MHKGAVLSGFGCIFCSLIPRRGASWMMLPLGMMSTTFMVRAPPLACGAVAAR